MKILGVDPGTRKTGVGLIETQGSGYQLVYSGIIQNPANRPIAERLQTIYRALSDIIDQLKPDILALEDIFYGKDFRAMVRIGEARACAMLAASGKSVPVVEYAPAQVKQAVSGNGQASKLQVQQMIKTLLHLKTLPQSDSSDALAVAICHGHRSRFGRLQEAGIQTYGKKTIFSVKKNKKGWDLVSLSQRQAR
ncbi:MAG: crossover junction endodeoxyribonuclease RuvC [Omnitrophica bacterium GWA2_52_8]|nr:MAG: crossover junction endodeoxyribonuclease RuvC [Omnitrophica bacterium GWA2_52_8]